MKGTPLQPLSDWDLSQLNYIISEYGENKSHLISILQDIQKRFGYLPRNELKILSHRLGIPLSKIYKVATFYKSFSLTPRGRHVCQVCMGTACHVRGAPMVLESIERELGVSAGGTTGDMRFSLVTVNCLGACALGPVVVIDGEYHGHMTPSKVVKLLGRYR